MKGTTGARLGARTAKSSEGWGVKLGTPARASFEGPTPAGSQTRSGWAARAPQRVAPAAVLKQLRRGTATGPSQWYSRPDTRSKIFCCHCLQAVAWGSSPERPCALPLGVVKAQLTLARLCGRGVACPFGDCMSVAGQFLGARYKIKLQPVRPVLSVAHGRDFGCRPGVTPLPRWRTDQANAVVIHVPNYVPADSELILE